MNRRIIGAALVLCLIAALVIAFFRRPGRLLTTAEATVNSPHVAESFTPAPPPFSPLSDKLTAENETESQRLAGEADVALVSVKGMLRDYRARFNENPIGTNEEITRALLGKNPGGSNFESPEAKIEHGKLVDRWHHPYFFHQLSRSEMEIRSAGPDGVMWNDDDEVLH